MKSSWMVVAALCLGMMLSGCGTGSASSENQPPADAGTKPAEGKAGETNSAPATSKPASPARSGGG